MKLIKHLLIIVIFNIVVEAEKPISPILQTIQDFVALDDKIEKPFQSVVTTKDPSTKHPSDVWFEKWWLTHNGSEDQTSFFPPLGCYEIGYDYDGYNLGQHFGSKSPADCQKACKRNPVCSYWTFKPSEKSCFLKKLNAIRGRQSSLSSVSGPKICQDSITAFRNLWIDLHGRVLKDMSKFLPPSGCYEVGYDYFGHDLMVEIEKTPKDCQIKCQSNPQCFYWTSDSKMSYCYLKTQNAHLGRRQTFDLVSGSWNCTDNDVTSRNFLLKNKVEVLEGSLEVSKLVGRFIPFIAEEVFGEKFCQTEEKDFFCDQFDRNRIITECQEDFFKKGFYIEDCIEIMLEEMVEKIASHKSRIEQTLNSIKMNSETTEEINREQMKLETTLDDISEKIVERESYIDIKFPPKEETERNQEGIICPLLRGLGVGSKLQINLKLNENTGTTRFNFKFLTGQIQTDFSQFTLQPFDADNKDGLFQFDVTNGHFTKTLEGIDLPLNKSQPVQIIFKEEDGHFQNYINELPLHKSVPKFKPEEVTHFWLGGYFEPQSAIYETKYNSFEGFNMTENLEESYFDKWCFINGKSSYPGLTHLDNAKKRANSYKADIANLIIDSSLANVIKMKLSEGKQALNEDADRSKKNLDLYEEYQKNLLNQQQHWVEVENLIKSLKNKVIDDSENQTFPMTSFKSLLSEAVCFPILLDTLKSGSNSQLKAQKRCNQKNVNFEETENNHIIQSDKKPDIILQKNLALDLDLDLDLHLDYETD